MIRTLLPSGCYDMLPPYVRQEREVASQLLAIFDSFGYEQVSPPMLEYTESLLAGRGAALATQTFRVMDPSSNKVMGIRPDITLQIARIAATRLAHVARPLRLSYEGHIFRMQAEPFRSERQLHQVGLELIGATTPEADAEIIVAAAEALNAVGIADVTIDLNLPGVVGTLLSGEALGNEEAQEIFHAVASKDATAIRGMKLDCGEALIALMQSSGPATEAISAIASIALPDAVRSQCAALESIVQTLGRANLPCHISVDITENRGFEYHTGICYSFFARGADAELGRGGRYRVDSASANIAAVEATGFTLYLESLQSLLPPIALASRVLVHDFFSPDAARLRAEGYVTIHALGDPSDIATQAKALDCTYIYQNGALTPVTL